MAFAADQRAAAARGRSRPRAQAQTDVLVSPVCANGFGRHESLLALEACEPGRLIDVVRDVEASEARRYIDGPLAAITGVRKPLGEIIDSLP